jgi:integration host factor subunit alpha
MALTKAEMAERLFEDLGLNKLSGFGNFDLRDKKQRPGRNPKTGENIPITARRVVTFRPGQKLKARVEAYAGTQQ